MHQQQQASISNGKNDTFRFAPRKAPRSDDAPSPATASVPNTKQRAIATQDDDLDDAMPLQPACVSTA